MSEEDRPNPEELLQAVMREEAQRHKGRLKIFLGMAAGVGKTYAMLEAAQKLKIQGGKVVVGVVDTHGRLETGKLLEGLETVPLKKIKYKDTFFEELDIDAIIKLKPQVAIIDELAHSNVPGSRHPKRWQDVVEILDNGIDVYTTLNVQHIESLKDVVERITGITIRETVPDVIIETAALIELVDLTPDELLQRLKEGKVYLAEQSAIAARHFFQPDRLTALREIVLRYAAEKIDHDLQGMFPITEHADTWKPRERLLVAISYSPHSQKLIRITRRLAFNMGAPWIAVHVDDGKVLDDEDREMLAKNLALARDLGAEVVTTHDSDVARGIQKIARQKSVTQIIIGRPPRRGFFDIFQRNTLVDRLARECSDIDLHVIRQTIFTKRKRKWRLPKLLDSKSSYLFVAVVMLSLAAVDWFYLADIEFKVARFSFLMCILLLSIFFRKGPLFFATFIFAGVWGFLFIPFKSTGSLREDILMLVFYSLTAIITAILTDRAKTNKENLTKRERSIEALYEIVQEIATSPSMQHTLASVKDRLSSVIEGRFEIIPKELDNGLAFEETALVANEKEKAAAQWVFQNGKEAGWSTSTLPSSQYLFIPLKGLREVVGVLAYHPKDNKGLSIEEKNFIYTVGQQLAHHFERYLAEEKTQQMERHKQVEKIYQSILNLISDLFEGPLLTIQDSVKELKKTEVQNVGAQSSSPIERIQTSSESLANILENILAMVNLSAGLTPIKTGRHSLKDLISTCSERLKKSNEMFRWSIRLEPDLPDILFDYDLIELLFFNIVFHAMEFSPPGSTIEIEARQLGDYLVMYVAGEGQSIPPEMVDVAFEKFYRLPGSSSSGLGLGLAIAKAIAQIHGGELKVQNRPKGGMIFTLFLPIE